MRTIHPAATASVPVPEGPDVRRLRASIPYMGPTSLRLPEPAIRMALVTDLLLIIGLILRG